MRFKCFNDTGNFAMATTKFKMSDERLVTNKTSDNQIRFETIVKFLLNRDEKGNNPKKSLEPSN